MSSFIAVVSTEEQYLNHPEYFVVDLSVTFALNRQCVYRDSCYVDVNIVSFPTVVQECRPNIRYLYGNDKNVVNNQVLHH